MCQVIEVIHKHPKMRRILRCESPYFHHCQIMLFIQQSIVGFDEFIKVQAEHGTLMFCGDQNRFQPQKVRF